MNCLTSMFVIGSICLICRPVLTSTGIFDQLRVDKGNEWVLLLFVQELLAGYRYNQDRPAHFKSASTENYTVERIWPEVNSRINYPIKNILIDLEEREVLDLTDEAVKYCVSIYMQSSFRGDGKICAVLRE